MWVVTTQARNRAWPAPQAPTLLLTIKETTVLTFMASHSTVLSIALLGADP